MSVGSCLRGCARITCRSSRPAPRRSGLRLERLEHRIVPDSVTFAQFVHNGDSPQVFAYSNNGGMSADFTTIPGGDRILLSFAPQLAPGLTSPQNTHLFLTSHTAAPTTLPLPSDDLTGEPFPTVTNTIQIVLDAPVFGKTSFLTVTYSDTLSGRLGSHEASLSASDAGGGTPPDVIAFTSDFINFGGTITHGFSLSLGSINSDDNGGGLQRGAGDFFQSFTAAATGTFDATFSGAIAGRKFEDTNGDGMPDPGKPGLAGWTIILDAVSGTTHLSTVTDASGNYSFANLDPGTYRVREEARPGWIQTTVNPTDVTVVGGSTVTGMDFGNFRLGSIAGQKFQDSDGNGADDPGEPGLAGWTIVLDAVNGATHLNTVTDANGKYGFTNLGPGTYRVREIGQSGWMQTTVDPPDLTIVSGSSMTGVDFGNRMGSGFVIGFPPSAPPPAPPILVSKLLLLGPNLAAIQQGLLATDSAFIDGLYQNLLNRPAEVEGLSRWILSLLAGFSRQQVATAFWQSAEHRTIEVDQFYATFLGRAADAGGRALWVATFLARASETDVIRGFLMSPEYQATRRSDVSFVNGLYAQILNRAPDPDGRSTWLGALQKGFSRRELVQVFLTCPEVDQRVVDQYYALFLNRRPDAGDGAPSP
jgi:hypothetical protein